jgi:hypothetical protein
MVLSYVTEAPTLATCALTSLTFHDLVIPLLYCTVCLKSTSWTSTVDTIALFLHGVLAPMADAKAMQRKTSYLCHLKALILHAEPRRKLVLIQPSDLKGLFPSLRYIEFCHILAHSYSWLFSQCFNIQHVYIQTYESGR